MKNLSKVLALVLVIAMVFSMAVSASAAVGYTDDAAINHDEAVQLLTNLNVLTGYTDGSFKPTNNITRAELTVMLSYLVGNEDAVNGKYNDIAKLNAEYKSLCTFADSKSHWAAGFIAFCYGNEFISGRDANTFDPEGNVTIAEAAVMLLRVMGYDAAKEDFGTTAQTTKGFKLQLAARNAGLLNGLDYVEFFAPATREQVAQLFLNALDAYVVSYDYKLAPGLNLVTGSAAATEYKLVNVCFWPVEKIVAANSFGLLGHQWVSYENTNHVGAYTILTDVYVDDTTLFTYTGGTAYSKVASDLGLNAASSNVYAMAFVNGEYITAADDFNLPGEDGSLKEVYTAGVSRATLPDNCTLVVTRNYDTSVGRTIYKLMYYYEFVATVAKPVQVTSPTHPYYGQYAYAVTYYWDFDGKGKTEWIYDTAKDAYASDVYYLVVPNASNRSNGSTTPSVIGTGVDPFLGEFKVAKTVASFTPANGKYNTIKANNGAYIYNATANYNVSKAAHDFGGAAFGADLMLIMNTAGYVAGYEANTAPGNVAGTGYLYVDGLEFAVTAGSSSNLINPTAGTWSAQAKALVYFPVAGGNNKADVIDLTVAYNRTGRYYYVAVDNTNTVTNTDKYVAEDMIILTATQTPAAVESNGYVTEYSYITQNLGNVRVYNTWFDGWYKYTQYTDGTYSLAPVAQESITVTKGNANVVGGDFDGLKMLSTTTLYDYTMDLGTMTAYQTLVATGYKKIGGTFGDGKTNNQFLTEVGCNVDTNKAGTQITNIEEFYTLSAGDKYDYTWYVGKADYSYGEGKYAVKFYVDGALETLYLADEVIWNGSSATAQDVEIEYATALSYLESTLKDTTPKDGERDNLVAFTLTVEDGYITAIDAFKLEKGTVSASDADGWIVIDTTAVNYVVSNVWNVNDGGVDAPAKNDTVYFVTEKGDIVAMWIVDPAGARPNYPGYPGYVGDFWWTK